MGLVEFPSPSSDGTLSDTCAGAYSLATPTSTAGSDTSANASGSGSDRGKGSGSGSRSADAILHQLAPTAEQGVRMLPGSGDPGRKKVPSGHVQKAEAETPAPARLADRPLPAVPCSPSAARECLHSRSLTGEKGRRLLQDSGTPWYNRILSRLHPSYILPLPASGKQAQEQRAFLEEYSLGPLLGQGAYGLVHCCTQLRTGRDFAVKIVHKSKLRREKDLIRARREFVIQKKVSGHEHVLQAEAFFEDQRHMYLVMERCTGGDLFELATASQHAGWLDERHVAALFAQLVSALMHCKERGVLHRDVKLENVLVADRAWAHSLQARICGSHRPKGTTEANMDQNQDSTSAKKRAGPVPKGAMPVLKLADFGSALIIPKGEEAKGSSGGSLMYQAPEVLSRERYDFKADAWSLGVILFTLLSGAFPFTAPSDNLIIGMIKRGVYVMAGPGWKNVSDEAKDVVARLLTVDVERRASVHEVSAHPWLRDYIGPAPVRRSWSMHMRPSPRQAPARAPTAS